MHSFESFRRRTAGLHGGDEALAALLPAPASADELRARGDDRYLSLMSVRVFSAGLKQSMVEAKWPAFEEAFHGFDPNRAAAMPEPELDALMRDKRLIRHWPKLSSVPHNARAMLDIAGEAGGFGAWIAAWPASDIVGLWAAIGKRFKQMGGRSAPTFLRMAGKDTFMLSPDVVRALLKAGAVGRAPSGKRDLARVQEAFNVWAAESGRPLCAISRTLALAMG